MKRKGTAIILVVAAILIIGTVLFQNKEEIGNKPGMIAENFALPMYNEPESELHDYFGDVIILNMWASWCEPCKKEMPDFMDIQADYGNDGLTVLTVNMHTFERTAKDAPNFIEEMGITLPVFIDEDGDVAERYQVAGLPVTYIINRDGTIKNKLDGEVTYERLEEIINPLL